MISHMSEVYNILKQNANYTTVSRNKKLLLKYANDKISSLDLFNRINENAEVSYVNEGSGKIIKQNSGLSRYVWIGPYENTNHYLRLKIQNPKSSTISEEWASLSIPDLEIKKEWGESWYVVWNGNLWCGKMGRRHI